MISTLLEQKIFEGKAVFKTLSMAACEQLVLPVPVNSYIIITGYNYLPACTLNGFFASEIPALLLDFQQDLIQYVQIINSSNFFAFPHHLEFRMQNLNQNEESLYRAGGLQRQTCYIIAKENISFYFTRLNDLDMTLNQAIFQQQNPIFDDLGYGSLTAIYEVLGYNDASRLQPLTTPYTRPYTTFNTRYNQAFVTPKTGALNTTTWSQGAIGKSRANHIVIEYYEIFEQPPVNVI